MPQLSPMMGFIIMIVALGLYLVFLTGMATTSLTVEKAKVKSTKNPSYMIF